MAHGILAVKLCELEDQLTGLSSRIHLSETAGHDRLRREIETLSREYVEADLTLQKRLQRSRAEIVSVLADAYDQVGRILHGARDELERQTSACSDSDVAAEEKILLAEYGLDFAMQAANRALLLAMQAMDAQLTQQEQERRTS